MRDLIYFKLILFFQKIYKSLLRLSSLVSRLYSLSIPQSYYSTVQQWLLDSQYSQAVKLGFEKADSFHRKLPKSLTQDIHSSFLKEENRLGQAIFAYKLSDIRVWSEQGTVITPDNKIIVELSPEFRDSPQEFNIFQQSNLKRPKFLKGQTILLAAPAGQVYGHWMMDVLPRLAVLERLGISWQEADHYFVNSYQRHFQSRSLELLDIPKHKWVSGEKIGHVQCKKLIAPSLPGLSGNMPDWAVTWLRNRFLPHAKNPQLGSKIFVVRKSPSGRNLLNQNHIIQELQKYGFVEVELERLSFEEQIGAFYYADTVIGANGSGMFNMIFCQPETIVVELFGDSSVNVCQWAASQSVNINYAYLIGKSFGLNNQHPHTWDYNINIQKLTKFLSFLDHKK